jgi:hypothetical protein
MALTPDEIKELKEQLKEINKLSNQLGAGIDTKKFADVEKHSKEIKLMFDALSKRLREVGEETDYLVSSFQEMVSNIKNYSSGVQQTTKALKGLSSISLSINEYQRGYSDLTSKEIKKLNEKLDKEKNSLYISQLLLKSELDNLNNKAKLTKQEEKDRDKILKSLKASTTVLQEFNNDSKILQDVLNKAAEEVEEIEKHLGLSGALTSSLSDSLSKLGMGGLSRQLGIDEAKSKMDNLAKSIVKNKQREKQLDEEIAAARGTLTDKQIKAGFGGRVLKAKLLEKESIGASPASPQLAVMMTGIKSMGSSLKKNLLDPLTISVGLIKLMIDGFLSLDKAQTEFQRETGRTVAHIDTINASLISSSDYIKQATELTKQFGFAADLVFTSKTLQEATELKELMGLSADEAGRLAMFSKINGKELKNVGENIVKQVSNFNKTNKTAISQKAILQDVAKVSNEIAMKFGGNPEKIAAAATEARKLGLTLEGVDKTADSLLNFESSITNELKAELLTGQQLNLERARLYALNEDIAGLTKEIGNNEALINGYTKGNRIQREAIADAIGMSKEDLAKMVYQQQLQTGLTEQQAAAAAGVTLEDMKRLSIQESINKSIEKMGEALAGPLEMLAKILSMSGVIETIFISIGTIMAVQLVKSMMTLGASMAPVIVKLGIMVGESLGMATATMATTSAMTLGLGTIAALAAAGVAAVALTNMVSNSSKPKMAKGGIILPTPGGIDVTVGEAGSAEAIVPLNSSRADKYLGNSTSAPQQDLSPLLEEMRALRQEQSRSNGKPIIVDSYTDSTKTGTAIAMRKVKIQ